MDPKPKRDMDTPVNIDGDFEEVLTRLLNDPELPPVGEPLDEDETDSE